MSPIVVWMMALSDTLLGPSACVAAITSSFEGFSLKMSLSESALLVSSGSLFENFKKRRQKTYSKIGKMQRCHFEMNAFLSHQVKAVLLKSTTEDGWVRLYVL